MNENKGKRKETKQARQVREVRGDDTRKIVTPVRKINQEMRDEKQDTRE